MCEKLFKDPVHGYIAIPADYCKAFIDTPIFQRLRNIEQTSMRCLFPGAHHDRFVHSLGVFHIGREMYDALCKNTKEWQEVNSILCNSRRRNTFLIACLMHDCGHAPFSHTLEGFYNDSKNGARPHNDTYNELVRTFEHQDFLVDGGPFEPAPHEAMSALVLKKAYADKTKGFDWNAELAARMITGCKFHLLGKNTLSLQIDNILIGLLNGSAIDADKLDYIVRDTWASGVKNSAVDIQRLIQSLTIIKKDDKCVLAYQKSSISVIQSVIDARNYLYEWIYNHHTVVYFAEAMKRAVIALGAELDGNDGEGESLQTIFSSKTFFEKVSIRDGAKGPYAYLLTDGDILLFLKLFCHDNPWFSSYESHTPAHFAVWKTEAEYRAIFGENAYMIASKSCIKTLRDQFGIPDSSVIICNGKAKLYALKERDIFIDFGKARVVPFTEAVSIPRQETDSHKIPFFYLFIENKFIGKKTEILQALQDEAGRA